MLRKIAGIIVITLGISVLVCGLIGLYMHIFKSNTFGMVLFGLIVLFSLWLIYTGIRLIRHYIVSILTHHDNPDTDGSHEHDSLNSTNGDVIYKKGTGRVTSIDRAIIQSYFAERNIRKLHIGCGESILDGWLNSDLFQHSSSILHLDATDVFPFANDTFDYIYSEHMIEHISYSHGLAMLRECNRVLKNNGTIRISTPNLQFLIDLYRNNKSELQMEYIKWATDTYIETAPYYDDTFVINNFVRCWRHAFIYDEKTLRSSLEKAGFAKIIRCDLNESEHETLRNLENEERLPKGFLKLESVTLEGTKIFNSTPANGPNQYPDT
jgi:predicted SAM-dependent methyltransferase